VHHVNPKQALVLLCLLQRLALSSPIDNDLAPAAAVVTTRDSDASVQEGDLAVAEDLNLNETAVAATLAAADRTPVCLGDLANVSALSLSEVVSAIRRLSVPLLTNGHQNAIYFETGESFLVRKREVQNDDDDEADSEDVLSGDADFNVTEQHDTLEKRLAAAYCRSNRGARRGVTVDIASTGRALYRGWNAVATQTRYYSAGLFPKFYPKRFQNHENIRSIVRRCPGGLWFEFPILLYGRTYGTGGRPGTDRVIFDRCGNWCATITHRGETGNTFHECT
jgi:hypothetical protein